MSLSSCSDCSSNGPATSIASSDARKRLIFGWRARILCQPLGQHGPCRQLDAGRDTDQDIVEQLDLIVGIVGRCAYEKIGDAVEYFGALGDGAADDRIVQFFD